MRKYKPSTPFNIAMKLLVPTSSKSHGTTVKTYPALDKAPTIFGSFRTFGGTETMQNDVLTVLDTVRIETWYRPDIRSNCRLYICETGETYEIIGTPENIEMRNQWLTFKAEKVGGEP